MIDDLVMARVCFVRKLANKYINDNQREMVTWEALVGHFAFVRLSMEVRCSSHHYFIGRSFYPPLSFPLSILLHHAYCTYSWTSGWRKNWRKNICRYTDLKKIKSQYHLYELTQKDAH
jgi:hypothetical protein